MSSDTGKVAICNLALMKVGEGRISSLDSPNEKSRNLKSVYDHCVKKVLSDGFFRFSMVSVSLTHAADVTPEFEFSYAFPLPEGFLRLDKEYEKNTHKPYRREGQYIYSNTTPFKCRYVKHIMEEANYSTLFVEALSSFIAYYITPHTDKPKKQELYSIYRTDLSIALQKESGDDNYNYEGDQPCSWIEAHNGRCYG